MPEYPKPIMKKSELLAMGFPDEYLMYIYRTPGQKVAHKLNPTKKNSPLIFDTGALEQFRQNQIKIESQSMPSEKKKKNNVMSKELIQITGG